MTSVYIPNSSRRFSALSLSCPPSLSSILSPVQCSGGGAQERSSSADNVECTKRRNIFGRRSSMTQSSSMEDRKNKLSPKPGPKQRRGSTSATTTTYGDQPQNQPISEEHWMDFHHRHHGQGFRFSADRIFESNDMGRGSLPRVLNRRVHRK